MDESVTDEVRRQSILKSRPRFPLQEVQSFFGDEDTVTTTLTRNRRVSFGRKVIKEFLIGSAVSTQAVHEYEQSSESVSDPSDCSGPLDLALNKSCRDLEAEMEISGEVITPPESFSDTKAKDPEQRARLFTENCISIAKSVFQDTETELTAIIIGAKPSVCDEEKKNSSCMSFTTLEVSNDFGHKHHDFMAMRHTEMLGHPDHMDKGRYDFLDQSVGNSTLSGPVKPARQLPRSPCPAPWETENDENIPPAHCSFRNARASTYKGNTSEATMEFTCARMKSFVEPEVVKEDPLNLDGTNDEFIDELLEDDTDSSPLKNIQRELANLSNVNQSFRERVGLLNSSSAHGLNQSAMTVGSEPSFLLTPSDGGEKDDDDEENAPPLADCLTPSKGNISVFDDSDDDLDGVLESGQSQNMEFTNVVNVRHGEVVDDEPLKCSGEKTKIVEMTMEIEKSEAAGCVEQEIQGEPTMEFTQCNRLRPELVETEEENNDVTVACEVSFTAEETGSSEFLKNLDSEPTMEFTHCNRLRQDTVSEEKPEDIAEFTMEIEEASDETTPAGDLKPVAVAEDLGNNIENEPTMEFTHCNRLCQEVVEDAAHVVRSEIAELTMEVEGTCDELASVGDSNSVAVAEEVLEKSDVADEHVPEEISKVNGAEDSKSVDNPENEQAMEFTHCNRLTQNEMEETCALEKPHDELVSAENSKSLEAEKSDVVEHIPKAIPKVNGSEDFKSVDNTENEQTMEFTHCNRLRQEVEDAPRMEKSEIAELTMEMEATCDKLAPARNLNSVAEEALKKSDVVHEHIPDEIPKVNGAEDSKSVDNPENEETMEFTHCNRLRQEVEDAPHMEKSEIAELTMEIEGTCDELAPTRDLNSDAEEVLEKSDVADEHLPDEILKVDGAEDSNLVENEQTMEFSHCNRLTQNEMEETCPLEKPHNELASAENSKSLEAEKTRPEDPTTSSSEQSVTVTESQNNETNDPETSVPNVTMNISAAVIATESENPLQEQPHFTTDPSNRSMELTNADTSTLPESHNIPEPEMEMTSIGNPNSSSQINKTEIQEPIDDTLPAEPEDSPSSPLNSQTCTTTENITQINSTMDPPLETPLTGMAALSARPSLKQQLQTAAPDSTTTSVCYEQSELIEDALRSMDITETSIRGVLPKPMRTMSNEQHMKAVHESTRVIEDDTLKIPTDSTYTLHKIEEATFTIPGGLNVCNTSAKRTHTDSPCPGERLKKTRASCSLRDSFGKRMHTDSPLPEQSLSKKTRDSNTPKASRTLNLDVNDSLLHAEDVSGNLDVSVTLNDITLSQNEKSFGILPMSLPERSIVPDEMELTEVTVPVMPSMSEQDTITTHMPVIAMSSLAVDESELEVSSTSNNYYPETDSPDVNQSCGLHETTSSAETNEKIIRKVHNALEQMSHEKTCIWKLLQFNDGIIRVDIPLLHSGLILDISFTDINITSLLITHREVSHWREIKRQVNNYGFETLRRYIQKEEKKIHNLEDIPFSLDFFNNYALKLKDVMNDALAVLHGCAGSKLSADVLSFRVLSYRTLVSCWVDINLSDLLVLDQLVVRFRHETGRFDEQAVHSLATRVHPPMLQNFVRSVFDYVHNEEAKFGVFTQVPTLLF